MPVDSAPAVMFRRNAYGMRQPLTIQMGAFHAAKWENYAGRNCWQWLPGEEGPDDIIAYIADTGARRERESASV